MAQTNPQAAAAAWVAGMQQAGPKITAGINAVTTAPGQAAARQKAVYVQNVANSADKWAQRVANVTLQDWQNAAISKGVGRVASGATAAEPKMVNFLTQFLPYVEAARNALPPRGNLEQNIARSVAMMRKTAEFSYKS